MNYIDINSIQNVENNKMFELYTLVEIKYENYFKTTVDNIDELYPEGWYGIKDYQTKIEILAEAIKENVLILNTKKYQELIEVIQNKQYLK